MKYQRLGILLLLTALFSITLVNSGRACNDISVVDENTTERTVLHGEDIDNCTQVFGDCTISRPGQDCPPDSDDCGHCHCPGCGSILNVLAYTVFAPCVCHSLTLLAALDRQTFYFDKHIPEHPYLPIWQPPQLKA